MYAENVAIEVNYLKNKGFAKLIYSACIKLIKYLQKEKFLNVQNISNI